MSFRKKLSGGKSRRLFTKTAQRVHGRNAPKSPVMRGGIRL